MSPATRLTLLLIVFGLLYLVVISRLFYWQVWSYQDLASLAEKQHQVTLDVPAKRGRILASDGFPLVANKEAFLVYASLPEVKTSPNKIASDLAVLLATPSAVKTTQEIIEERLSQQGLIWVPIKRKVDRQTRDLIEQKAIEGIGFESEEKRQYPEASMAANLLGFVGSDIQGTDKGYFGIEGYYDRRLRGLAGHLYQERGALGVPILVGGFGRQESKNGDDLVLFLDRSVQLMVEKILKEGVDKFQAKAGSVVVMEIPSGGILAMASFPNYEPSSYFNYDKQLYKNPVVADLFEPGSIIKPLVMAAALNEKAVTYNTRCDRCGGPRQIGSYTIETFNDEYQNNLQMSEIIERSDNVGMVFVAEKLGVKDTFSYLEKLGFGEKTEIDLEEETFSDLRPLKQWRTIDLATASFGQGIAVTRIQMIKAFSTLANRGKSLQPRVVSKIIDEGKETVIKPQESDLIFKPEVTEAVTEMLVGATNKSPLHFPRDRIPELKGFRIAAKSGTAEIPVAGEYDPEKTIASVIGYAPADKPRFVVLVSLVEPTARPWGSDTAGPIFFEILKELFLYYGIQPEK